MTFIKNMTSRKRGKRSNNSFKGKIKSEETEKTTKYNPYIYFNGEEIAQIKTVLKIKEVLNIPITIGCVILNKFETLEKALKGGLNVNEIGPNNTTALVWAVRYKYLNLIEFLLENGADPTIKIDNGENVVIIALEHKLWDEATFIYFWKMVKKIPTLDVNSTNKNGHTVLHIAVRREWEKFIEILLTEKVNIDITNINGVTPLMTACFRNNLNIVNVLINGGADFNKEDAHFRTALCYAITTGAKLSKPPYLIAERIIFELKKDLSFKEYIKRKIQIINLTISKDQMSESELDMLVNITQYIVQYTENGLKIILDIKIFEFLQKAIEKSQIEEKRKLLLLILQELLCYNEQVIGFSPETQLKLTEQFLNSDLGSTCLKIVTKKETYCNLAYFVLLMFCTLNEIGQNWLKKHYEQFKKAFQDLPADYVSNFQMYFPEEKRLKLMKKKIKKLRRTINTIEGTDDIPKALGENQNAHEKKYETSFSFKKSKRRSKVMKAKITKIKNMELAERLALNHDKSHGEVNEGTSKLKDHKFDKNNELAPEINSLTNKMKLTNSKKEEILPERTELKLELGSIYDKLLNSQTTTEQEELPVSNKTDTEKNKSVLHFESQISKEISENEQMVQTFMTDDLFCNHYFYDQLETQNPITCFLKHFLETSQVIPEKEELCFIPTYPEWKSKICKLPFNDWSTFGEKMKVDKRKLKEAIQYMKKISLNYDNTANAISLDGALHVVVEYLKELLDIIISKSKSSWDMRPEVKPNRNGKKSNFLEKQTLTELQANFQHLVSSICSLAHSNLPEALKNIYHLESTLLNFPVRGKTLLSDVCALENVKIQYTTYSFEAESSFLLYIENVLNGFKELREDIKITVVDGHATILESEPPGLFQKEISLLSPAKPRNKRKELEDKVKTMENAYHLIDSIQNLVEDDEVKVADASNAGPTKTTEPTPKYSDIVLKILTKHVAGETSSGNERSRWSDKVHHLQAMKHSQLLLGGDVRLGRFPERSHIISQGGNFNLVTLGLCITDQPLAVKKIPREHCVCKVLKALINPLLGLRNKNILHYFVCDYEENDLILATPLCEYNIGQYVLLLKENADKKIFNLNQMEIVKQFLNGMAFLHQRLEPIVHGNLKPSNIFVDIHGIVRLAEFGINKALFKLIEAPKSSLIWFSQETYRMYRMSSVMECSLCSDIQVAGMLIYFIVSGGVHPFGPDVTNILKNLEKVAFNLPPTRDAKNQIFADLVSWMLMYEPNDRPNIKQILSHVLFWTNERRWRFILNCSGIATNGVPLAINTSELHDAIDKMSAQEQIKGHWVSIARKKFPRIKFQGDDTVVGLLKFIKQFYENQVVTEESVAELKNCILTYFPAFPLTLYRILEATGIIKEFPFISYTIAENLVS